MHVFFLSASGPLCLFGAFAFLLFRASWELWPFALLAAIGMLAVSLFKRKGFYAGFISLAVLAALEHRTVIEQPWCALFLTAAVFSWGITLLGHEEIDQWLDMQKIKRGELEESNRQLQELVQRLQKEAKPFDEEFKAALASRNAAVESQHRLCEEVEKARQQCDALNEQILGYQRKEKAFQAALEDAQSQVLKYKYAEPLKAREIVNPIVPQESAEEKTETSVEMRQLQHRYAQLKAQFEEKSEALNQARRELFRLEGELTVVQKEAEEKQLASCSEDLDYQAQILTLAQQCQDLESQVQLLEELVSFQAVAKKSPKKTSEKKKEKEQPLPEPSSFIQEAAPLLPVEVDLTLPLETDLIGAPLLPKEPAAKKKPLSKLLRKTAVRKSSQYSLLDETIN